RERDGPVAAIGGRGLLIRRGTPRGGRRERTCYGIARDAYRAGHRDRVVGIDRGPDDTDRVLRRLVAFVSRSRRGWLAGGVGVVSSFAHGFHPPKKVVCALR